MTLHHDHPAPNPLVDIPGRFTRREFMRRAGLLSGAGLALPWAVELAALANAAPPPGDDYRALVCVFLYGGNDYANTFIPDDDESYASYLAARGTIARPRNSILTISPRDGFTGAGSFGFAPELAGLHRLFTAGDAAVVANIGTLERPLTKAEYQVRSNRPPQLFSHNDQQSFWQAAAPEGATTGWGGRIADLLLDGNGDASTFTCVSVAGNAVMMTGERALQYQVSSGGVTTLRTDRFRYDGIDDGLRELMSLPRSGMFPASYTDTTRRALTAADDLASAVDSVSTGYPGLDGLFGPSRLAGQLRMVARLIAAGRDTLGLRRQVFFVATGGFDNHNGINTNHPGLLLGLDDALTSFYDATARIGAADSVTTFTASDFGRTLVSNGDGSDHGWGGHHVVVGGAVTGNKVYGTVPVIADDGPDDVGRGRLIPTTSVDQYAATFATWMGVGSSELQATVPNIANYTTRDLGLFDPPRAVVRGAVSSDGLTTATRLGPG